MRRHGGLRSHVNFAFLLSYPRSGSHLLRYCVEIVAGYSTLGTRDGLEVGNTALDPSDTPLSWRVGVRSNFREPILVKRHVLRESDDRSRPVVLLVRDPIEAVVSHARYEIGTHLDRGMKTFESMARQMSEVTGPVHLVNFEDLVSGDRSRLEVSLRALLEFLSVRDFQKYLAEFVEAFDEHLDTARETLKRRPLSNSLASSSAEAEHCRGVVRQELEAIYSRNPKAAQFFAPFRG